MRRLLPPIAPFAVLAVLAVLAWPAALRAQTGDEVPFVTTPDKVTLAMLRLAGVTARDHVLDLGSGDGRIVIAAARHFGARGTGVEIVPELVERSRGNAQRAGVAGRTRFLEQDLFSADLGAATVITMYLLPEVNLQLRPQLLALRPGTRIVSHDWDLGDWRPDRTHTVAAPDKPVGRDKLSRLHLWVVPARIDGLWCGDGGRSLRVEQRHQFVQAQWTAGDLAQTFVGRVDGSRLRLQGSGGAALHGEQHGEQHGERLRLKAAGGAPKDQTVLTLRRPAGAGCPG